MLLLIIGALLLIRDLVEFAWVRRSIAAATIACVLVLLGGLVLQPWSAFGPPSSADPDEAHWLVRFRFASIVWVVFLVGKAAWLISVLRLRK